MPLLVFKVVAMAAIAAIGVALVYVLLMPTVRGIRRSRRRAVALGLIAFIGVGPLVLMALARRMGEHDSYLDELRWLAPVPAGYLLCLAVSAVQEWRRPVR
ncbi:MAG: hypothetical protein JO250_04260 [Armatimonadetes bacterium]|nr:hypothetical protein [Armatimonadota bacterium]